MANIIPEKLVLQKTSAEMKTLWVIIVGICPFIAFAQVEHNFEMGPENTDCHKLPSSFASADEAIAAVEASTFRFQQSIRISRFRSPRSAVYYSCNGESGFLIANETDDLRVVYPEVPKAVWDEFINADDPIYFYENEIKGVYDAVK